MAKNNGPQDDRAKQLIEAARREGTKELNLSGLNLTTLPAEISLLTALQTLNLSRNQLATLPPEIGSLVALQTLILSSNQLTTLPPEIGSLIALRTLEINRNRLTTLPREIGSLSALQGIGLNDNQLTTLPPEIGSLTALTTLDLSANQLAKLPPEIRSLPALRALYLHGNYGLGLTPEVLGPAWNDGGVKPASPHAIIDYYFRISTQAATPLNEGKMILVGRGEVGKTSLVLRLRENKFNPKRYKTDGIRIEPWEIALGPGEKVLLHVWDFGGQEIMHATHRFFLTRRSLYLVVLNGREGGEDTDAEYWLKTINALAPDSPVLIVLNKHRSHPVSLNRTGLCAKYPNICGFVETDCAGPKPLGIAKLKQAIKQAVNDHLPDVRAKFPASWFKIKDGLSQMRYRLKKDFITFDEYRELCEKHNESDAIAQENLAGFLNDLGIALNYKDDPRLSDKHVLNPQWVTEGIYKILNASALAESGGALQLNQVGTILTAADYPKTTHSFIVELMRKFELCFPVPEREGDYLIPELLSKDEHQGANAYRNDTRATRFHYRYEFLPEGLIPRFIVRTYIHSKGQPRWRTGVVLKFEGNAALVRADMAEERVEVIVAGEAPSRRRLLAVIRSQFDYIHAGLKLQPREEVPVPNVPGLVMEYGDLLAYEREGELQPRVPFGGTLHKIDVMQLLSGIDIEGARLLKADEPKPVRVFCSYSSRDEEFKAELETHLSLLKREGKLATWHTKRIDPGKDWDKTIDQNIKSADIILLMISPDFLASDYINDVEVKQAMSQHERGKSQVIPVFIRECSWTTAPFGRLQCVPKGKAVKLWPDRDSAWREVSDSIRKIVDLHDKTPKPRNLSVSAVRIQNIRGIEELNVSLSTPNSRINAIIGDNGTCKSTLLRCIALATCDEGTASALIATLGGDFIKGTHKEGKIEIDVVDPDSHAAWTLKTILKRTESTSFQVFRARPAGFPDDRLFIVGYGSSRRRSGGETPADYEKYHALLTLFDYEKNLHNPEVIISRVRDQVPNFDRLLRQIDKLLMLDPGATRIDDSGISVLGPWGSYVRLTALGDGYQGTLTWILDMIGWAVRQNLDADLDELSGIVLIDELEQHLHPHWQRRIISLLSTYLPRMQFFVTTHSPLCASSIDPSIGQLVLFRREGDSVTATTDLPTVVAWRTDQVLASELFGYLIDSDPKVEQLLKDASILAGKGELRSEQEESQYLAVKATLKKLWISAAQTPIEREVHDEWRAKLRERIDQIVRETGVQIDSN